MKNNHIYRFLKKCPVCKKEYLEHWKVVNHIRKSNDGIHFKFLNRQINELVGIYLNGNKNIIHKNLFLTKNIFSGISYEKIMLEIAKHIPSDKLEIIRRDRISKSLKNVCKTLDHNKKVSESLKKAWKDGKFDTNDYKIAREKGYKNRRSYNGSNNPMYGRPSPVGSGRGKGGIRPDIGHYVRSTWEANFCRVLNYTKRSYLYEPNRFEISVDKNKFTYCPDIYIPTKDTYYEIKGHAKSSTNWECDCSDCKKNRIKIEKVKKKYKIKIVLIGKKEYRRIEKRFKNIIDAWEK